MKFSQVDNFQTGKFNAETGKMASEHIDKLTAIYRKELFQANNKKDEIFNSLVKKLGNAEAVSKLKEDYYNKRLAEFALNKNEVKKIIETERHTLFQTKDPVFKKPETNYGRAHFYAAEKIIFGKTVDTIVFDIVVIWLSIIIMYVLLLFNGFKKLVDSLSNIGFAGSMKKKQN